MTEPSTSSSHGTFVAERARGYQLRLVGNAARA